MFADRKEAGKRLAEELTRFKRKNVIVLAIPRGGVITAYEVAKILNTPLDLIIPRKIGLPSDPEFAIGAVAPDGAIILDENTVRNYGIQKSQITKIAKEEIEEIQRRMEKYRGSLKFPDVEGKIVIIVDDGIATGHTVRAAIKFLRKKKPKSIIVAVPVAPYEAVAELEGEADEIFVLETPENFHAIGMYYENFPQTSDEEVIELLKKAKNLT